MPSTLTWIDHDAAARERSLRIIALFQEKERIYSSCLRSGRWSLLWPQVMATVGLP